MTVRAIISGRDAGVTAISPDATVSEAVKLLATGRIGAVPVTDGDAIVGIFSERDVIYGLEREGAAVLDKRVGDVMTLSTRTHGRAFVEIIFQRIQQNLRGEQ